MISKLLQNDRPYWVSSSIIYALMGLATLVSAGPLSWSIRAVSGESAGSAGVSVGILSGVLLLAAVLGAMCARRTPTLRLPVVTAVLGAGAAFQASVNTELNWYGLFILVPVLLSVLGVFATRRVLQYQQELEEDAIQSRKKRKHAAVDVSKASTRSNPDLTLTLGLGVVTVAFGVIGSLVVATMTPLFSPDLPEELANDGQLVVGEGNPVAVEIAYGINYPHTMQLFGDDNETLATLVDDGVAQLTMQGVSLENETRMSVPVRVGEVCAWEVGGAQGAFQYLTEYNQLVVDDPLNTDVAEVALAAGQQFGSEFTECHQSGKYELSVGQELEKASSLNTQSLPKITVDGEDVQPESVADLEELVLEAAE